MDHLKPSPNSAPVLPVRKQDLSTDIESLYPFDYIGGFRVTHRLVVH